ncbi:MAG: PTS sugar transporter subunit IIA [Waddliaceae bacterium]
MMKLSRYLDVKLVTFLETETRYETLRAMVDVIEASGKLTNKEEFFKAIIDREAIISTGIGMGVAIPHAKLPTYDNFFIAIGLLKKGVDWDALDEASVRIVFMIGGPDDKQTEYLQILSGLTVAIKDEERRKKMLSMQSPKAIIDLFKAF